MTLLLSGALSRRNADFLSESEMPAQRGEVPSLDGIRALSVTIVLLSHFVSNRLFPGGLGVLVFFVISGFLITRLLLAEVKARGTIDLKNFYIRRFLRLYPIVVVLTVIVMLIAALKGREFSVMEPLSTLFYFANYYYSWLFATGQKESLTFSIFWSLSVEEHFYLIFPALLIALNFQARRIIVAMLAVMVVCLMLRLLVAGYEPQYLKTYYFYYRTEFRLDSLAVGVLMAALCESATGRRFLQMLAQPAAVICSLLVLVLCLAVRDPWFRETLRYSLLGLSVAGLIAAVLFSSRYWPAICVLNTPLMNLIGRLSYSLYVWHLAVAFTLGTHAYSTPVKIVLEFGGSFAVALISYYFVEQPFLRLRRKFGSEART